MKKVRFILFLLAATSLAVFQGCKKDDDDDGTPQNLSPSISLDGSGGGVVANITLTPGEAFTVEVVAIENSTSNKNLENFFAERTFDNFGTTIVDSTFNEETFEITLNLLANAEEGDELFEFTITDKDGESSTVSFTVTTETNETPLATENSGEFYHIGGSLQGAYDLVADMLRMEAENDTTKDMLNTDMAGMPFTGSFGAANQTLFVKNNAFDYDNATVEGAAAAYAAGVPNSVVANPVAGDIFIAKIRNQDVYAVVKIDAVDPADNTCMCGNTGKITFDYKKE